MKEQDVHFRHILLYYFRKGKNASQAQKKLCAVYGDEALKERHCRNWFERFRSGDFSLKNSQRSGHPVESNRHSTTRDIAEKLNKLDLWIPHQLKEIHLMQRISICDLPLLKRNENDPFLKNLAPHHTSLVTRQKLLELGWDVLSHPPYSPNLAPSDYHLFRSMQNSLNGKTFNNADDVGSHLIQFINGKDQTFFERGIFISARTME
ncbi:unnamed protein product [Rodentolepis nana]|uniref:HTH_48 domain-containing protein n=1 Tax=Rodentolepis nana TaxID=102285 RepID=A0A0R3TGD3_RODNA|nr:unnamed protein product [Rodentolepis nana]